MVQVWAASRFSGNVLGGMCSQPVSMCSRDSEKGQRLRGSEDGGDLTTPAADGGHEGWEGAANW